MLNISPRWMYDGTITIYKSVKGMNRKQLSKQIKDYSNPQSCFFGMCNSPAMFQLISWSLQLQWITTMVLKRLWEHDVPSILLGPSDGLKLNHTGSVSFDSIFSRYCGLLFHFWHQFQLDCGIQVQFSLSIYCNSVYLTSAPYCNST